MGALLREENIKILCIQETWMKDEILDAEIHIDEFRTYRQDRGGTRKGGGVVTYVDTGLTVTQEESFTNGIVGTRRKLQFPSSTPSPSLSIIIPQYHCIVGTRRK